MERALVRQQEGLALARSGNAAAGVLLTGEAVRLAHENRDSVGLGQYLRSHAEVLLAAGQRREAATIALEATRLEAPRRLESEAIAFAIARAAQPEEPEASAWEAHRRDLVRRQLLRLGSKAAAYRTRWDVRRWMLGGVT
jgi:hypothetical protein